MVTMLSMVLASTPSTAPQVQAMAAGWLTHLSYLAAAAMFILSLKWLSAPKTARRGVFIGELGMLLAVVGTLLHFQVMELQWVAFGIVRSRALPRATVRKEIESA